MLTKRNYFVILMLFIVVFIMFMLVDISAGYLTRNAYNPQADIPVTITADRVINIDVLDADAPASARAESSGDVIAAVADNPMIAIIVSDKQGSTASVMRDGPGLGCSPSYELTQCPGTSPLFVTLIA